MTPGTMFSGEGVKMIDRQYDPMDGYLTEKQYETLECVAVRRHGRRGWWCVGQLQYFARMNEKNVKRPDRSAYPLKGYTTNAWRKQLERLSRRGLVACRWHRDSEGNRVFQYQLTNLGRAALKKHETSARAQVKLAKLGLS